MADNADRNRMNASNLGVVFGPTLMTSTSDVDDYQRTKIYARIVAWMIEYWQAIESYSDL